MFGRPVEQYFPILRDALRVWSFHRSTGTACIVSYQSIRQAPLESIRRIAAYLGLQEGEEQLDRILEATSLKRLKTFSRHPGTLDGSRLVRKNGLIYDRETLLHVNHIRDGRIGYGAAALHPEQLQAIDAILREEHFEWLCEDNAASLAAS